METKTIFSVDGQILARFGRKLHRNYAKLARKNATPPPPKIGRTAKRCGQFCALPVSFFFRAIGVVFNQIVQRFVHLPKTKTIKNDFSSPTPNRLYSISFVKTNALGGFLSSGTAVLTDFLKDHVFSCKDLSIHSSISTASAQKHSTSP